jgi:hypothetical protein
MSVKPYTISVPDDALEKLSQRLSLVTFPDQLDSDNQWDFGAPCSEVRRLANYWRDGFNWRKAEAQLNELPNFKTPVQVDGFGNVDVHCKSCPSRHLAISPSRFSILNVSELVVHQISPVKGAIPLLFSHGCKTPSKYFILYFNLVSRRAGFLHRSEKTVTVAQQGQGQFTRFPHRSSFVAQLRVLERDQQERLWCLAIWRNMPQVDAGAWI